MPDAVRKLLLGLAVAMPAVLLQAALQPWLGQRAPFLFIVPTIIFAAAAFGRLPAAVVMLLGALQAQLFFALPGHWLLARRGDQLVVLGFLAVGTLLTLYGCRLQLRGARARRAEERLNLAQDETGVGLFELDYAAGTASVSPALCRMLGQPVMPGSMPLQHWLDALDSGHVEDSRRSLQAKIAAGELRYERELKVALPDGSQRWLLSRIRLDLDARGQIATARGATLDISARKQLVATLEQTQAEQRQQLEDLNRLHALSNRLLATPYLDAALQATLEAVAGFHGAARGLLRLKDDGGGWRVAAHCGFDAATIDALTALPHQGTVWGDCASAARRVAAIDIEQDDRYSALRPLAAAHGFGAVHCTPLVSGSGAVLGVLTVFPGGGGGGGGDVERLDRLGDLCAAQAAALVERELALVQARSAQHRFEVALQSSAVSFTILAPVRAAGGRIVDFTWTYANAAASTLIGHPAQALVGRHVHDVLPDAWQEPGMLQRYIDVVEQGRNAEFDTLVQRDGAERWLHVIASPLDGSAVVWFADVTQRREQEQALQQADRRKDEFLATLAHELRNPLAPVRQAAAVARDPSASAAQLQWSHGVIERQLGHMAVLLDDLLDVSRITHGTLALRLQRTPLQPIVQAAVETARPLLDARRHRLTCTLPDAPLWLDADPLRLEQVLANLLANAAKYTDPDGSIELAARLDGGELVLAVSDTGIGLRPEDRQRVFEMFTQVPDALGRAQGGLGIGLSLSRGLVLLHGGTLQADSPGPGCGSTFTVRLPARPQANPSPSPSPSLAAPPRPGPPAASAVPPAVSEPTAAAPTSARRRILVADDNRDAADTLAMLLGLQGHDVQVAYDGDEALLRFASFQPQVALLDVGMPGHNGLQVAELIRRQQCDERVTLVAVTGWGQQRDRQRTLQAGFDHHLTKPVQLQQLQALLDG